MNQQWCPIRKNALHHPDTKAVISINRHLSFRALDRAISDAVLGLRKKRIKAHQRVAIWASNSIDYVISIFALLRIRAVVCPVNIRMPLTSVLGILKSINCKTLLVDRHVDSNGIKVIQFKTILNPIVENNRGDTVTDNIQMNSEQDATILFTSATSGAAKAVLHTFGNHWFSALGSNDNIPIQRGDRWLLSLGLWHTGGLAILFRSFIAGGTVVVTGDQKLSDSLLNQFKISHVSWVPTQLGRLLRGKKQNVTFPYLKHILLGGDSTPKNMLKKAVSLQLPIHTSYGSTEAASQVTTTAPNANSSLLLTAGRPLKFRELSVTHDGEILIKGKTLCKGYLQGNNLVRPFDQDGWYHSGDLGKIDQYGNLIFKGRKDNMFISGGENIQPEEIETALLSIEWVSRALVSPASDKEFGFRPVAFIETTDCVDLDSSLLIRELEKSFPRFKIPIAYYPWPKINSPSSPKLPRHYFKNLVQTWRKNKIRKAR